MSDIVISIPHDYSPSPAGRTSRDGPFNGERFRDNVLVPALRRAESENAIVIVYFDNADSYSSSFLEEVFGGLVRKNIFPKEYISKRLQLRTKDPVFAAYVADAESYIKDEMRRH
jgi:hypothetical protein